MSATPESERWKSVADLFERASELPSGERPAFLEQACGADAALRQEIESLLAFDDEDGGGFGGRVRGAIADTAGTVGQPALEQIGHYRLRDEIGRGGMGTVYLADRDDDFNHRVAIKVVRGFMGPDALRRFRSERQILATLQHPGIARLLDGGTTADGGPYLVMEFVDGLPIDRYCDQRALGLSQRLALFGLVCEAVSYAHRSLVVHRDLKPSNILVTADGIPKLLDFGIAKLIEDDSADLNQTSPSMRIMTPHVASPEQVRGEPITTATDIYSLGVLLYLLLAGKRPYEIESRRPEDIERIVCHQDPPKPSSVVDTKARTRELKGDLDTIVMTALHKEPARRYASVDQFAEDLVRSGDGRPVMARPSTWRYRTQRFVRRHRAGAAIAAIFVVTVIGFAIALAQSAAQARSERNAAERVTAMLIQMFSGSDPRSLRGDTITAREILDQGAAQVRTTLRDQPDMQARLLDAIGAIYVGLGMPERAQTVFHESMTARQSAGVADSQPAARTMWRLATTLHERGQYTAAEPLARAAYDMTKRLVGPVNPQSGETLNTLAMILSATGRHDEAETMFLEVTQIFRDTLGPQHAMVGMGLQNTARVRIAKGDPHGAEQLIREALVIQRRMFGNVTGESLSLLAGILEADGKPAEAIELRREALALRRVAFGGNPHPALEQSLTDLARALVAQGAAAEAAPLLQEAEALRAARAK
jgi:serine/threonine protein kinase/tetratricopeptide (TPR) repeat protein